MRLTAKGLLLGLVVIGLAGTSSILSALNISNFSIFFAAVASVLGIILGRLIIGNYTNFTVIFLTFNMLYGLSGPFSALYGEGLPIHFLRPYLVDEFILHYSLGLMGLAGGLLLVSLMIDSEQFNTKSMIVINWDRRILLLIAQILAVLASIMEEINFLRIGGWETLLAGKAVYQSALSELTGTLPSEMILMLSIAFLGLSLSKVERFKRKIKYILCWLILGAPVIISWIILGRRLELLQGFLIFLIAYYFFKPIKVISVRFLFVGFCLYLILNSLYGIRGMIGNVLTTGDLSPVVTRITEREFWVFALNPASNEFGSPFGNFNTHWLLRELNESRYGETYLTGLTIPIPRFIWPEKPQSITYEFRDTYFSDWANRGVISGTAFSSILEAYLNFGTMGVPMVYFVLSIAIAILEKVRLRSRSLAFTIFYIMLIPEAIIFHRSSFGMPLFWPLLLTFIGIILYILLKSILQIFARTTKKPRGYDFAY